jgi:NADH-quinone oxidoreductase subunit F
MLDILQDIVNGKGRAGDIELLQEIGDAVKNGSLCALGGTAPNPALTTIRYFRDEYEEHIKNKRCPARVCSELISYNILPDKCKGCRGIRKGIKLSEKGIREFIRKIY